MENKDTEMEAYNSLLNFVKNRPDDETLVDVMMDLMDQIVLVKTALNLECEDRMADRKEMYFPKRDVVVKTADDLFEYRMIQAEEMLEEMDAEILKEKERKDTQDDK